MGILGDICNELTQRLANVQSQCQVLLISLDRFDSNVTTLAIEKLRRKLVVLKAWIITHTESVAREHKGQGFICVFVGEANGIYIQWVEDEELVTDRGHYAAFGLRVLSLEEFIGTIDHLLENLDLGNWDKVVDWLNKYGKSPGLVF